MAAEEALTGADGSHNVMEGKQRKDGTWFYRDLRGNVHGPYTSARMDGWHKAGFFNKNLFVRKGYNGKFKKFAALGNDPWKIKKKTMHGKSKAVKGTWEHSGPEVQGGQAGGIWGHVKLKKTKPREKKIFKRAQLDTVALRKAKTKDAKINRFKLDDAKLRSVEQQQMELLDAAADPQFALMGAEHGLRVALSKVEELTTHIHSAPHEADLAYVINLIGQGKVALASETQKASLPKEVRLAANEADEVLTQLEKDILDFQQALDDRFAAEAADGIADDLDHHSLVGASSMAVFRMRRALRAADGQSNAQIRETFFVDMTEYNAAKGEANDSLAFCEEPDWTKHVDPKELADEQFGALPKDATPLEKAERMRQMKVLSGAPDGLQVVGLVFHDWLRMADGMWLPVFIDGIRVLVKDRPNAGLGAERVMKGLRTRARLKAAMGRSGLGVHALLLTYGSYEPTLPKTFKTLHVGLPSSMPIPKVMRLLKGEVDEAELVQRPTINLGQLEDKKRVW